MSEKSVKVIVYGTVQGVGFRYFTLREAERYHLRGHATNLADGTVEVVACGPETGVDKLLQWLETGPRTASVSHLDICELPAGQVQESTFVAW